MKKLLIRFFAGLLASVLLVTGVSLLGNMPNGKRTDGIFYEASGIHPDAVLMTVNKQSVTAEEFLYWLAYDCDYLASYMGGNVDFDTAVSGSMTYGQYALEDAQRTVTLYAVVRDWAQKAGITLSEESQAQLDAQRQQYVTYYGGEEGYAKQLQLMGLTDEGFTDINGVYFLYAQLYNAYCTEGGQLYPAQEEIDSFAKTNEYYTFLPLYWAVTGTEETDAASLEQAKAAVERLRSATDKEAVYLEIAQEMALQATAAGETAAASDLGSVSAAALAALAEGEVSDVVQTQSGYYVFVRKSLNTAAVVDKMFNATLDQMRENAGVRFNCRSYDKLNVTKFYTKLQTLRSQLTAADTGSDTGSDIDSNAGTDTTPQS